MKPAARHLLASALALVLVAFGPAAFAQEAGGGGIDVTAIVADIGAQAVPVAAIGAAVLLLFVGIKAFKWVRKALS